MDIRFQEVTFIVTMSMREINEKKSNVSLLSHPPKAPLPPKDWRGGLIKLMPMAANFFAKSLTTAVLKKKIRDAIKKQASDIKKLIRAIKQDCAHQKI